MNLVIVIEAKIRFIRMFWQLHAEDSVIKTLNKEVIVLYGELAKTKEWQKHLELAI